MPIDLRDYKVIYGNHAYKVLTVEPIWDYKDDPQDGIHRPWKMRVTIIDHDAQFAIIEDYYEYFKFVKEVMK